MREKILKLQNCSKALAGALDRFIWIDRRQSNWLVYSFAETDWTEENYVSLIPLEIIAFRKHYTHFEILISSNIEGIIFIPIYTYAFQN